MAALNAADPSAVVLKSGRAISADEFYAERDARTTADVPALEVPERIAITLSDENADDHASQIAFVAAASMVRRMGRAFAPVVLIASEGARRAQLVGTWGRHLGATTLDELIEIELSGADPFASWAWRSPNSACFSGVGNCISIGNVAFDVGGREIIVCSAGGWVAQVSIGNPLPRSRADATVVAMVGAAALGVARVFGRSAGAPPDAFQGCWSCDTGAVTSETATSTDWLSRGSSSATPLPLDEPVHIRHLVLLSAGGIGMNAALLLGESNAQVEHADIVDPDAVEISNLNRLLGTYLENVGDAKSEHAAALLATVGTENTPMKNRYEDLDAGHPARNATEANDVVLVGVDQIASRLEVQSDWPRVLVNGATGGLTTNVSVHRPGEGCIGCLHANANLSFAASRQAMACAVGFTPGGVPVQASYPFVSVAAAAGLVATALRASLGAQTASLERIGRLTMNVTMPMFATVGQGSRSPRCLLLCGDESVANWLAARSGQ